ncbi:UDP-glucose 4-epimerase GalE [Prochlorococcus marinus]|uniref:UDP-glucose 4-epimerase n=1 Tax=Prochlorococcus marinus (strain AS9601) TaxID=146891 RepID=A2BSF0_PROMS|nr:UDP-glucose 4-epimerase GalE [Prochlorococcus marinus]ABM70711.1 UDP-glucose 4-epimerase [Prochlorococcus marinus str. AS9601]
MKTVLTTGGLGYIGSHTVIALINRGFNVLIIDSLINSKSETFNNIEKILFNEMGEIKEKLFFRKGDLRNKLWLENIFQEFNDKKQPIEAVIHFAGLKSIGESILNPLNYYDVNLNTTLCLLSVMSKFKCFKLIFSSSATVYKIDKNEKISENGILSPLNPYGNTKLSNEKIIEDVFKSDDKRWKIANLRYFNPCGAHDSGIIGENPLINHSNIFPTILRVINREIEKLPIYGSDWPTKDGTCIRDYIHVMDLAEAHLAALIYLYENEPTYLNLNIGTGTGISVLELIKTFSNVNNCQIPYYFTEKRKGDAAFVVANNSLVIQTLKWEPKRNLKDICKDSWRWFIKSKEGSNFKNN